MPHFFALTVDHVTRLDDGAGDMVLIVRNVGALPAFYTIQRHGKAHARHVTVMPGREDARFDKGLARITVSSIDLRVAWLHLIRDTVEG